MTVTVTPGPRSFEYFLGRPPVAAPAAAWNAPAVLRLPAFVDELKKSYCCCAAAAAAGASVRP